MNAQTRSFGRTASLILVIAVLLVGGLGVTNAAAKAAIPGDALYPLKTSLEQTRLVLAQDAGDRAEMKLGFADRRLAEIAALLGEGRFTEVSRAVLAFEADMNSAILELETVAKADPARAARIASEVTAALTRYAQTLSAMAASAPESVRPEVLRALDTTRIAGSLDLPSSVQVGDDNSNVNVNGDDSNTNTSLEDNSNGSADDSNTNASLDDNSNGSRSTDDSNTNTSLDDNSNGGANTNGDDSGGGGGGGSNSNGDDSGGGGGGGGGNSNDGSAHD